MEIKIENSNRSSKKVELSAAVLWGFFTGLIFTEIMLRPFFLFDIFYLLREFFIYLLRMVLPDNIAWHLDRPIYLLLIFSFSGAVTGFIAGILRQWIRKIRRDRKLHGPQGLEGAAAVFTIWTIVLVFLKIWTYDLKRPVFLLGSSVLVIVFSLILFSIAKNILPGFNRKWGSAITGLVLVLSLFLLIQATLPFQHAKTCDFDEVTVPPNSRKVAIIGVDGASWNLIEPLIHNNALPNLSSFIQNGSSGFLRSFKPMRSPVIWTSIATGKHSGLHGIDNFIVVRPGITKTTPVTSNLIKEPTIWEIFSSFGKQVSVNGWYVSWPAQPVNGTLVSDLAIHPQITSRRTYPPELTSVVDSVLVKYEKNRDNIIAEHFGFVPNVTDYTDPTLVTAINIFMQSFKKDYVTLQTALRLLDENGQPPLFAIYFVGTDRVQHKFFKYLWLSKHPMESRMLFHAKKEEIQRFDSIINDYMIFVDNSISKILDALDRNNTDVFIVSDHGFGPITDESKDVYHYNANTLFNAMGLLNYIDGSDNIDLSTTVIYEAGNLPWISEREIYFPNRQQGWDKNELMKIKNILSELHCENGEPVFTSVTVLKNKGDVEQPAMKVNISKTIYGNYINYNGNRIKVSSFIGFKGISGDHRMNGVVAAAGPDIKKGKMLTDVSVFDIAPTLCYLAELPVLKRMTGKVILKYITKDFRSHHKLRQLPDEELPWKPHSSLTDELVVKEAMGAGSSGMDSQIEQQLLEEMKTLGYIQ